MRSSLILSLVASGLVANALPSESRYSRRQDIDFDLVDDTPEPSKSPTDTRNYNQASAVAAVISDVDTDPLPQQTTDSTSLSRRDVVVVTADGYSQNTVVDGAAINAPLNCNKADTYMGVKLFNDGPFDTTLCAAACTIRQPQVRRRHADSTTPTRCIKILSIKDSTALYTQAWNTTYATNKGQWRGTAHYTIGRSFIASNATDPGLVSCLSSSSSSTSSSTSASSTITVSSSTSLSSSSPVSSSSTTSSSTTSSAPKCTFAPTVDAQQQGKDTAALDFLFSHNTLTSMLSSIPFTDMYQNTITGDVLPPLQTALQNVVSCGPYNITSQLSACRTATDPRTFTSCIVAWTDPAFLSTWALRTSNVPTSAVTRFIITLGYFVDGRNPNNPVPAGVQLSPDMSPIAVRDAMTAGGSTRLQCEFKILQYYFGEPGGKLAIACQ
ncbi:hypothetical protein E4T43_04740 [Aureobasidium subglaciale]|nr:hypothetical protein E4T43_04740 [Aureobasidium subglaciale]